MPKRFHADLQFPLSEVHHWAAKYGYGDDDVMAIAPKVRRKRVYGRDEFLTVCRWKSKRPQKRAASNNPRLIEEATRIALTAKSEQLRIGVLTILDGVSWPTASALLHLGHRDPYPILDFRALASLGNDQPHVYTFSFWWGYVECCRDLARRAKVDMRTLDRALWAFSASGGQ